MEPFLLPLRSYSGCLIHSPKSEHSQACIVLVEASLGIAKESRHASACNKISAALYTLDKVSLSTQLDVYSRRLVL